MHIYVHTCVHTVFVCVLYGLNEHSLGASGRGVQIHINVQNTRKAPLRTTVGMWNVSGMVVNSCKRRL